MCRHVSRGLAAKLPQNCAVIQSNKPCYMQLSAKSTKLKLLGKTKPWTRISLACPECCRWSGALQSAAGAGTAACSSYGVVWCARLCRQELQSNLLDALQARCTNILGGESKGNRPGSATSHISTATDCLYSTVFKLETVQLISGILNTMQIQYWPHIDHWPGHRVQPGPSSEQIQQTCKLPQRCNQTLH